MDFSQPHRRYNPLRKSWVLVSPHRTQRPWQGAQEDAHVEKRPQYDPKCYLCAGNTRANGETNDKYTGTFIFRNDFAAVKSAEEMAYPFVASSESEDGLFRAEQVTGDCYVICFSPRHDLTLAQMEYSAVEGVVDAWIKIFNIAKSKPDVKYCQIFENKGSAMGCSNPHPHGQAWMTSIVPEEPALEHEALVEYEKKYGTGLLEAYTAKELAIHESGKDSENRFIEINDSFIALVPFWAVWPYEILVISRRKVGNVTQLNEKEKKDFAKILRDVALRYDNLFQTSFPYSMGLHQSLINSPDEPDVEHLHVHFYPPLLRSATVRKFLVGFEMLGMPQRDLTPELAASNLRKVDGRIHYMENTGN